MNVDTTTAPEDAVRTVQQGWSALRLNPFFVELLSILDKEHATTTQLIASGDFPQGTSRSAGDIQGLLLREQCIGELRGLKRAQSLIDSIIIGLDEELRSRSSQKEQANVNQESEI